MMVGMKEWMVDKSLVELVADRGVDWTFCTVRPLPPPATILPSAHFGFPHTPGVGSIHKCNGASHTLCDVHVYYNLAIASLLFTRTLLHDPLPQ